MAPAVTARQRLLAGLEVLAFQGWGGLVVTARRSSAGRLGQARSAFLRVAISMAVAVGLGVTVVQAPAVYALVVPVIVSVGVLWVVLRWTSTDDHDDDRLVAGWTFSSLFLHLFVSQAIGTPRLRTTFFGGDADTYHEAAVQLARHWSDGTPKPRLAEGKEGFYYALARLYQLIGPYRIGGLAITCLCSALVVPLVADTTRRLFGSRARLAVLPLVVLLPGFLIWTSQLLREAPIMAALALGSNLAVRLSERANARHLILLGFTVASLFTLRANVAYLFGAGVLAGLVMGGRHLVAGAATAAALMGLMAALVLGTGLGQSGYQRTSTADLEQVNKLRSDLAGTADSGVAKDADVSTASGSLAYLGIGLPQFLLGPFPWQARNLRQVLGVIDAMTIWWLVLPFVRGLRRGWRRVGRRTTLLLIPAAGISLVLTLVIGNFGTLVRERPQVIVLLLPFIALGRSRAEGGEAGNKPLEAGPLGRPERVASGRMAPTPVYR